MASIADLFVKLIADTGQFEKDVVRSAQVAGDKSAALLGKSLGQGLSAGAANISKTLASMGQSLTKAGKSMTVGLTLPIVAVGLAVSKLARDFDQSMSTIVGLVGVAQSQVDQWSKDLLDKAPEWGRAPKELADALFFVTSAGFRGAGAMDVLQASAQAVSAGLGETKVIADAVTSAVNAYGVENLSAARATDILVAAVREGKLEASSLAPVIGRLLPTAAAMGVGFEQVAGALAVMSRTGLDAASASTSLSAILSTMLKPTKGARDALAGAGMSMAQLRDVAQQPGGLITAMRMLDDAFGDNEEELAKIVPNVRAFRGVMNILAQDATVVDSIMSGVADSVGDADKAFAVAAETAHFKLDASMARIQARLIVIGADVLPLVVDVMDQLSQGIAALERWWSSLDKGARSTIVQLLALTAAVGPLLVIVGKLLGVLGLLFRGISVLAGAKGIPLLISTLGGLRIAVLGVLGPIGLLVGALLALSAAYQGYMDKEQPVEASFMRLGLAAGKYYNVIQRQAVETARRLGISVDAVKRRVVAFADATGDTWDEAFAAIETGADLSVTVMDGWEAGVRSAAEGAAGAMDQLPDDIAATLVDGAFEVGAAAQQMVDPVQDALDKAVSDAADAAKGILAALESTLATGPEQIHDEMQDIVDALTDPYTEAERLVDIRASLINSALRTALTSDDPLLEAQTFDKINAWLAQWEILQPGAFDIGSDFAPWLNDGIDSTLAESLQWVQDNVTGPYSNLFDLADVLEGMGYDGLAAYARGLQTAKFETANGIISNITADIHKKFDINLRGEGYNTARSYADGLKDGQGYINDKANQIKAGLTRILQYSGSPPYTESRKIGGKVGSSWIAGIGQAIGSALRTLGPDLDQLSGALSLRPGIGSYGLAPALAPGGMPAVMAPAAGSVGPTTNYNLTVTGKLNVDQGRDALEELRRMQTLSLRPGG